MVFEKVLLFPGNNFPTNTHGMSVPSSPQGVLKTRFPRLQYLQFVEDRVNSIVAGTIEFPFPIHAGILGSKL